VCVAASKSRKYDTESNTLYLESKLTEPTHIAAGALVGCVVAASTRKWCCASVPRQIAVLTAVAVLAILAHVLMDLIPHYNWVANGSLFLGVHNGWYYREAVALLPVATILLALGRRHLLAMSVGMVAALYPDLEKVAYLAFNIPDRFVVFGWHSHALSSNNVGVPCWLLSILDMLALAGCTGAVWYLGRRSFKNEPAASAVRQSRARKANVSGLWKSDK